METLEVHACGTIIDNDAVKLQFSFKAGKTWVRIEDGRALKNDKSAPKAFESAPVHAADAHGWRVFRNMRTLVLHDLAFGENQRDDGPYPYGEPP